MDGDIILLEMARGTNVQKKKKITKILSREHNFRMHPPRINRYRYKLKKNARSFPESKIIFPMLMSHKKREVYGQQQLLTSTTKHHLAFKV